MFPIRCSVLNPGENTTLPDFLIEQFGPTFITRKMVLKTIKKGFISINNQTASGREIIRQKDILEIREATAISTSFQLELEVLYEDDALAIIHKPAGIAVSGNRIASIANILHDNLQISTTSDRLINPLPVHRLDRATQGLLVVAKRRSAHIPLSELFEKKKIEKHYRALLRGMLPKTEGIIELPIEHKAAKTAYRLIEKWETHKYGPVSLVELCPKTGRTHQLRIHMSAMSATIIGDPLYGDTENRIKGRGLMLQAAGIRFKHPLTEEEIAVDLPLPKKFTKFIRQLEK